MPQCGGMARHRWPQTGPVEKRRTLPRQTAAEPERCSGSLRLGRGGNVETLAYLYIDNRIHLGGQCANDKVTTSRRKLTMPRPINAELSAFIMRSVRDGVKDVGSLAARQFAGSRTTVSNYLKRLVSEGYLEAAGKINSRSFKLKYRIDFAGVENIQPTSQEDVVWRDRMRPLMDGLPNNVIDLCQYGFSEIFNNVIDHSQSPTAIIVLRRTYFSTIVSIHDEGVGIFEKIKTDFDLLDRRHALLELSKGKLTSDNTNHTGEGIFFASRMFDTLAIYSLDLCYSRRREGDDNWLIQVKPRKRN